MEKLIQSFQNAFTGLVYALKREQNLRIHFLAAAAVIVMGFIFQLSLMEWTVLTLTIGGMVVTELINTAIERTIDFLEPNYHPVAKQAKDTAAAACLIFAVVSVIIGLLIFLPKIMKLLFFL